MLKMKAFMMYGVIVGLIAIVNVGWSQESKIKIDLLQEDQFAIRSMKIFDKAGQKVPRIVAIVEYVSAQEVFRVKTVLGETVQLTLSNIGKIKFNQEIKQMSPMVQSVPWTISANKGAPQEIKIPSTELVIQNNVLTLNRSPQWELDQELRWEILSISYSQPEEKFVVNIQHVHYQKQFQGTGGGGPSGLSKGLQ